MGLVIGLGRRAGGLKTSPAQSAESIGLRLTSIRSIRHQPQQHGNHVDDNGLSNLFVQHERVLSHRVFQSLFGSMMTLLIAMEFQHSIIKVIERREHIIQTKIVVLIALLALTRKFIILDFSEVQPMMLMALSAGILSLGVVFWLIDKREFKEKEQSPPGEQADDITKPHL